jgi:hypothetical protein
MPRVPKDILVDLVRWDRLPALAEAYQVVHYQGCPLSVVVLVARVQQRDGGAGSEHAAAMVRSANEEHDSRGSTGIVMRV